MINSGQEELFYSLSYLYIMKNLNYNRKKNIE